MMRWLIIGLLVSMVVLLFAVAGIARHVWLHHAKLRKGPPVETVKTGEEPD
ncbi:MAG: hypothetical protein KGM96_15270 [Acidobacteriota bacterium]|nr:hypothetical protein [Acidobacteriota bacterium]